MEEQMMTYTKEYLDKIQAEGMLNAVKSIL